VVSFSYTITDISPKVTDTQTYDGFLDAATDIAIYYGCWDTIQAMLGGRKVDMSDLNRSCGIPFMAIGLVLFSLALLKKAVF